MKTVKQAVSQKVPINHDLIKGNILPDDEIYVISEKNC